MTTPEPDPRHDPDTDRLLEQELGEAIGDDAAKRAMERADEVRAAHAAPGTPAARDEPDARRVTRSPHDTAAQRGALTSWITRQGPLLAVSFAAFVAIGVILSLATGMWWALVVALAVHAVGTLLVATTALRLTTETEHVSPELAARLEAEGVQDPDRAFTELAAGGAAPGDVLRDGRNDGGARPDGDAAAAARQQRTAWTPTSDATEPAGHGNAVGAMPFAVVVGCLLVTLIVAIAGGGILWAVAAIAWAAGAGWLLLRRRGVPERSGAFASGLVALVVGVAVFGVLMGVLSDRL
ncbi:MAG TPA: hypothetical protein VFS37_01550 [Conexibacter sp.]|nr:hypothetical protein [Conexibacter sp.]